MYNINIITKKVTCKYNLFNLGLNITINNNIHVIYYKCLIITI